MDIHGYIHVWIADLGCTMDISMDISMSVKGMISRHLVVPLTLPHDNSPVKNYLKNKYIYIITFILALLQNCVLSTVVLINEYECYAALHCAAR